MLIIIPVRKYRYVVSQILVSFLDAGSKPALSEAEWVRHDREENRPELT
jgi:hypothetical protein